MALLGGDRNRRGASLAPDPFLTGCPPSSASWMPQVSSSPAQAVAPWCFTMMEPLKQAKRNLPFLNRICQLFCSNKNLANTTGRDPGEKTVYREFGRKQISLRYSNAHESHIQDRGNNHLVRLELTQAWEWVMLAPADTEYFITRGSWIESSQELSQCWRKISLD